MTVLVDPPDVQAHGRLWSHLASDTSYDELHAFARALGVPERGFERDHYDIPGEWYDRAVALGAVPVTSRELIARLVGAGLRRPKPHTLGPRRPGRLLLRPPRLAPGDLVAVVSPAGPVDPARLASGVDVLRSWGLRVQVSEPAGHASLPWLAAEDQARADELERAWTDPEVKAVWAARGGYGTQRLLDRLDWAALGEAAPTLLVGFSDVTALHQAMAARLGTVTVHGPGAAGLGDGDPGCVEATRRLVFGETPEALVGEPVAGGGPRVEGVLVGGNLTLLASSVGSEAVHPATGGIVALEDIGEHPYRLDRALTQLVRSGWLDGVRGIAVGEFTDCGDPRHVRAVLDDRLSAFGVPVVHGLPFGHGRVNRPIPLGVRGVLDAGAGTLRFGAAVR